MSITARDGKRNRSSDLTELFRAKNWAGLQLCLALDAAERPLRPSEIIHWAIALANLNRVDEALALLNVDRLDQRSRDLIRANAVAPALKAGRTKTAVALAARLAKAAPSDPLVVELLGRALAADGRTEEGLAMIEAAGRLDPANTDIAARRLAVMLRSGDHQAAAEVARPFARDPTLSPRLALLCLTALMRADDRAAEAMVGTIATRRDADVDVDLTVAAARWLVQRSRTAEAIVLCERALAAVTGTARLHSAAAEAYFAANRSGDGMAQLDLAGDLEPDDPGAAIQRLRIPSAAGKTAEAAALARRYAPSCHLHPRLAQACLTAFLRAGDIEPAAAIADRLAEQSSIDADVAVLGVKALLHASRPADAISLAEAALARGGASGRLHLATARAMFTAGRPFEDMLVHVEAAREQGRDDPAVLQALGRISMGLGRYEDAVDAFKKAAAGARGGNIFVMAKALKYARRYQEAADVMMSGAATLGQTPNWRRHTTAALTLAGREDQASSMYRMLVDERRAKLAPDFTTHLGRLERTEGGETIPQARLDWAWDKTTQLLGHPPDPDRVGWNRRARWGFRADRAILDWVECRPESIGEVVAMLGDYSPQSNKLLELLAQGRGLIVAGAHIGLMYAGPVVLQAAGVPFKVVAQMPRVSSATYASQLISTFDQSQTAVIRQIVGALGQNHAVTITVDATMTPYSRRVPWHGVGVTYTDFVATLSYRRKTPAVFAQPYWEDGRIEFVVNELPDAQPGESQAAFVERWREAYLDQLTLFMRRGPENLRLAEGIWRYVPV